MKNKLIFDGNAGKFGAFNFESVIKTFNVILLLNLNNDSFKVNT
jgi:hypothetical protein